MNNRERGVHNIESLAGPSLPRHRWPNLNTKKHTTTPATNAEFNHHTIETVPR